MEIATSDSLRQTAHHEDKENAETAMALDTGRTNAGTKRSKIRKLNPPRQKTQGTYTAGPQQTNQSQPDLTKSFF
jgi:hypothetical protein